MSQTKFTKGEWSTDRIEERNYFNKTSDITQYEVNCGDIEVCGSVFLESNDMSIEEANANASLIAAAPDMYAMIKELSSELESAITNLNIQLRREITSQSEDEPDYWDGQTIHEAQLLLKKARGE